MANNLLDCKIDKSSRDESRS